MDILTGGSQTYRNSWVTLLVRGIIAVLFGIAAFVWPGLTLLFLVTLFGAYAFIDGIIAVYVSIQERSTVRYWWVLLLEGIAGIIIGILTFIHPGVTAVALLYFIAAWAIITGILEIAAAFSRRSPMSREWTLVLGGVLSIILGILLFAAPGAGLITIVFFIAFYALLFGILLIIRAFQVRPGARGRLV